MTLAQDPESEVRAAAGAGLALMVASYRGGVAAVSGLQSCFRDSGTLVPAHIAAALVDVPTCSLATPEALTE